MAPNPPRPSFREHLLLFGRFLRHPLTVGAVAPSSPTLAREMVREIDPDAALRIIELGPGTGSFTGAIIDAMNSRGRLLAIELDPLFAERIHARFPQIECVCASAEQIESLASTRGMVPVDHVLSGVPFASLPSDMTHGILDGLAKVVRVGGTFTAFQYAHSYGLPPAIKFRREVSDRFGHRPHKTLVRWNIPPAWVLRWTMEREGPGRQAQDSRPEV